MGQLLCHFFLPAEIASLSTLILPAVLFCQLFCESHPEMLQLEQAKLDALSSRIDLSSSRYQNTVILGEDSDFWLTQRFLVAGRSSDFSSRSSYRSKSALDPTRNTGAFQIRPNSIPI